MSEEAPASDATRIFRSKEQPPRSTRRAADGCPWVSGSQPLEERSTSGMETVGSTPGVPVASSAAKEALPRRRRGPPSARRPRGRGTCRHPARRATRRAGKTSVATKRCFSSPGISPDSSAIEFAPFRGRGRSYERFRARHARFDELSPLRFFAIWSLPSTCRMRPPPGVCLQAPSHRAARRPLQLLPATFFHSLTSANHSIKIRRYDLASLTKGTRAEVWYAFRRFWSRSAFFPTTMPTCCGCCGSPSTAASTSTPTSSSCARSTCAPRWPAAASSASSRAAAARRRPTAPPPTARSCRFRRRRRPLQRRAGVRRRRRLFARGARRFVDDYVPYTPASASPSSSSAASGAGRARCSSRARRRPETVRILERDASPDCAGRGHGAHGAGTSAATARRGRIRRAVRRRPLWKLSRDRPLACGSALAPPRRELRRVRPAAASGRF